VLARSEASRLAPWAWFLKPAADSGAWAAAVALLAAGVIGYVWRAFRPEASDAEA
jgi:hypothetical protein